MIRMASEVARATGEQSVASAPRDLLLLASSIHRVLSGHRRLVTAAVYSGVTIAAFALSFLLRFDLRWPTAYTASFLAAVPLLVAIRLAGAAVFRLSTGRWRFVGTADVVRLMGAAVAGSLVFIVATRFLPVTRLVPISVVLMEAVLTTAGIGAIWLAYRTLYEGLQRRRNGVHHSVPVLIVGAGEAGNLLIREMGRFPTGYRVVGIVDDDRAKIGSALHGVPVRGPTDQIAKIARSTGAEEIIIAVPSVGPVVLRRIVAACEASNLPCKMLPGIAEVLAGNVRLTQVRELRIEDLLGRDAVDLDLPELSDAVAGTCVMITGAAGSIGSELARQIAHHGPGSLVLVDRAESDLYFLELELRQRYPGLTLLPIICDVSDAVALEHVFLEHPPEAVFHAAAYKHVPMMQTNVRSAIWNNVYGTLWVADAAGRHGARKCVLVSTDKAVRPTSIMGATKRMAEEILIELQGRFMQTAFTAVRFGNVLGSSGSVIPIFQKQIARGEPLTVTDPEATRYFMTIPESVQLILQASLLPELRGRIAMLDMGEPVNIVELARNLLRLSPQARSGIVFTGLRPGEKLHEELLAPGEETMATPVEKIRIIAHGARPTGMLGLLASWQVDVESAPAAALTSRLTALFPELEVPPLADGEADTPSLGRGSAAVVLGGR